MRKIPDSIQAFIDKLKVHNEEQNRNPLALIVGGFLLYEVIVHTA